MTYISNNTLQAKPNAPKPNKRKKWRTSTIQLVTNPPASSQQESNEQLPPPPPPLPPQKLESNANEAEIPVKLPRAMRSATTTSGGNPFRERNAEKSDESSVNKEAAGAMAPPRSPIQQNRTLDEKENFGL